MLWSAILLLSFSAVSFADLVLETTEFRSHTDANMGVSLSPDGMTLASCGRDGTVQLWDVRNKKLIQVLLSRQSWAEDVRISPDGLNLAASYSDGHVYLWDLTTRRFRLRLIGHGDSVNDLSFSPDSRILASGSEDATLRTWDVATGRLRFSSRIKGTSVEMAMFSHDGKTIASAGFDNSIRLWDTASGREKGVVPAGPTHTVAFSPDDRYLAVPDDEFKIRLWDLGSFRSTTILKGHADKVRCVVFSTDGTRLFSASADKTVREWDLKTGRQKTSFEIGGKPYTNCLALSSDGRLIAALPTGCIIVWEVSPALNEVCRIQFGHRCFVNLDTAARTEVFAAGCADGTVIVGRPR